jgi:excisionase family DNA binding protein
MPQTAALPKLLTVAQAASLLAVSEKTVRRWIDNERIPYLRLPGGGYRIPQGALLASLGKNYALGDELEEIDAHIAGGHRGRGSRRSRVADRAKQRRTERSTCNWSWMRSRKKRPT